MSKKSVYIIEDVDILVKYLYSLDREITNMTVQHCLYFLFAYYGALYSSKNPNLEVENKGNIDSLLFPAEFKSWKGGSRIEKVFLADKEGMYEDLEESEIQQAVVEVSKHKELKEFLDEMFRQITSFGGFQLLERNIQDKVWQDAYLDNQAIMDNEQIIEEYIVRYL